MSAIFIFCFNFWSGDEHQLVNMADVIQAVLLFRYSHRNVFTCLKHFGLDDFPIISSGNLSVSVW